MNLLTKKKSEFRSLLPSKGISTTIAAIKDFLLEESEKFNTLILIESQLKEVRKKEQEGVIDYERYQLTKNEIRKRLLDLISDIEEKDTQLTELASPDNIPNVPSQNTAKDNSRKWYFSKRINRLLINKKKLSIAFLVFLFALSSLFFLVDSSQTSYGLVIDENKNEYRTVELIGKTWLADNLNVDLSEFVSKIDIGLQTGSREKIGFDYYKSKSRKKYGRLYTLEAAYLSCELLGNGWRLPRDDEWTALINRYGGLDRASGNDGKEAYKALTVGGKSGFNAQKGGYRKGREDDFAFFGLGYTGCYWSTNSIYVFSGLGFIGANIYVIGQDTRNACSCRCVKS